MNFQLLIDRQQGTYVATESTAFENILEKRALQVEELKIEVGEDTDLYGWFTEKIRFCGFLYKNLAVFYLGQGDDNLFESGAFYYDVTMIIAPDRIGKSYKQGTFRDVYLRTRNNEKYWK